ncbi:hypothetical protein L1987_32961 [Smallanthus sonchifolius]|uniref:Uncharacterized protein n=1 Tax=Smallanthus sonchifolius TaxID=185202 RepID=A0ACB9HQI9_9ASTR|nr:hypothetical protein L1987_32961 [Smallanthus sonchifolius]
MAYGQGADAHREKVDSVDECSHERCPKCYTINYQGPFLIYKRLISPRQTFTDHKRRSAYVQSCPDRVQSCITSRSTPIECIVKMLLIKGVAIDFFYHPGKPYGVVEEGGRSPNREDENLQIRRPQLRASLENERVRASLENERVLFTADVRVIDK